MAHIYDGLVGAALTRASVSAKWMTETMPKVSGQDSVVGDSFTLARIERDRRSATAACLRHRSTTELQATMTRLGAEEDQTWSRPPDAVFSEEARRSWRPGEALEGDRT